MERYIINLSIIKTFKLLDEIIINIPYLIFKAWIDIYHSIKFNGIHKFFFQISLRSYIEYLPFLQFEILIRNEIINKSFNKLI